MASRLPRLSLTEEARNAVRFDRDPIGFLRSRQASHGDTFRFSNTMTVVMHTRDIGQILAATDRDFTLNGLGGGEGYLPMGEVDEDNFWSVARSVGGRVLARPNASRYAHEMAETYRRHFVDHSGQTTNLFLLMLWSCGQAAGELSAGAAGEDVAALMAHHMDVAQDAKALRENLPNWLPTPRNIRLRRSEAALRHRILGAADDPANDSRECPASVLGALSTSGRLEPNEIFTVMRTMTLGTMVTPAANLSWTLHTLERHPAEADRIRAEIEEVGLPRIFDDPLSAAPRLFATIREVLRLNSPWMLQREVPRDIEVGDVIIEGGQRVVFSPYLLHRDTRWWNDPESFTPDRWLGSERPYRERAFRPFGGGPRACPGAQVGWVQMVAALATLLEAYDFRLSGSDRPGLHTFGQRAPFELSVTLTPRVRRRDDVLTGAIHGEV